MDCVCVYRCSDGFRDCIYRGVHPKRLERHKKSTGNVQETWNGFSQSDQNVPGQSYLLQGLYGKNLSFETMIVIFQYVSSWSEFTDIQVFEFILYF